MILKYNINDIRPYISWLYFFHTWGMSGKPTDEKEKLRKEAEEMLDAMERRYSTHAVFELFDANSDGDDLLLGDMRLPLLRQQKPKSTPTGMMQPHASVSDLMFAHPQSKYFDLGKIGEDQLADYAKRRGVPLYMIKKFVQ